MRRFSVIALLLVVLGGSIALTAGAGAQDATKAAAMTGHPLVGAWLLNTDVDTPGSIQDTLASFSVDGVYTQVDADGSVGIGSWTATGPTTADMTFHGLSSGDDGEGLFVFTVRAAIEVAADGQTLTATYTLELTMPDGTSSGQYGPGKVAGTRIGIEPMGTPAGPISDLESQFGGGDATPEASPAP